MVHSAMGNNLPQHQAGVLRAHLVNEFLTSNVSGVETQRVAMFAKGYGASGVDDFAKVGSHGKHAKNCSRDLQRAWLNNCTVPKPYLATCLIKMPTKYEITYVEHPVLLPSELIMWLLGTKKVTVPDITNLSQRTHVALNNTYLPWLERRLDK